MLTRVHMPPLDGASGWLNSGPLSAAALRGHVVLVDFWTLTCINWLRTAPWIRAWSRAYRADGLLVVGVHTPEFSFERSLDGVRQAIEVRGIDHPVAVDDDHRIWDAFGNHYWPALYFVDADGVIRDQYSGEGRYEESERLVQRLLGVDRELVDVVAAGVEAAADWANLRTPETYLGSGRGLPPVPPSGYATDGSTSHTSSPGLRPGRWSLRGDWSVGAESVRLREAGGSIAIGFHARDVHLVLAPGGRRPVPFRVVLDGEAPASAHGLDVSEEGTGVLREGRLYQLIRQQGPIRDRTLEVQFLEAGADAYASTFG
ncbi:Thiol-disulfide isomerase or thioredoxin [Geodermatophilus telluris]|uniref:Thiol-disulfide isomerase or thioredoxin n=1 Tax=Geodermatophilus telluris TaxID=1190417 RepID=A0A1G6TI84_9ACTN|nr:redoxin domain-containing protein [Geodermatophilus telluris]SDD28770.1 Thiol-disulfide isomerase or thioredoxin [Geodermatophilus telluris]